MSPPSHPLSFSASVLKIKKLEKNVVRNPLFHNTWFRQILKCELNFYGITKCFSTIFMHPFLYVVTNNLA